MQTLNTQLWNLGTSSFVAALGLSAAACGPVVATDGDTDGGETESASDTIIDPSTPSETNPTTPTDPTTGGGCEGEAECPDGFYCGPDGQCIEDYSCNYGDDYGCYCVYGHCSPGYDCYGDEDCGSGNLCEGYGYCDAVQALPDCGDPATLVGTPLQIPTGNPLRSLSFVDLDPGSPGEDLVVGTDVDGWLLSAGSDATPLDAQGAVRGAAALDLDGDGATELVLIDETGLRITYGFGSDAEETRSVPSEQALTAVAGLANVEGLPSLVVTDVSGAVFTVAGSSERMSVLASVNTSGEAAAALATFSTGEGQDGFVLELPFLGPAALYVGEARPVGIGDAARAGLTRSMATGSLRGEERSDILWATRISDWTFLEISLGGETTERRAIYFDYDTYAVGDLDGDGKDDALAVGEGGLAIMPGDAQWGLTCFSQSPFFGGASRQVAIGDLDADGREEAVVITDAGGAPTMYDVSWAP